MRGPRVPERQATGWFWHSSKVRHHTTFDEFRNEFLHEGVFVTVFRLSLMAE